MITEQEVDRLIDTIWEPEDSEPTELTFHRTDEPVLQQGSDTAFKSAIVTTFCFIFFGFVLWRVW